MVRLSAAALDSPAGIANLLSLLQVCKVSGRPTSQSLVILNAQLTSITVTRTVAAAVMFIMHRIRWPVGKHRSFG